MLCWFVPPADIRMVEVPHKDQGLCAWDYSYLSTEELIH